MYEKGWWRTGTKKIYRATGEIHLWVGSEGDEITFTPVEGTPIVEAAGPQG
jgi:hypothetical protein